MEITGISAREILDSRGSPTLEAEIELDKVFNSFDKMFISGGVKEKNIFASDSLTRTNGFDKKEVLPDFFELYE